MDLTKTAETKPKTRMGRPLGKKVFTESVAMSPDLKEALVLEAKAKQKSFAALVRSILKQHVSRKRSNH